MKVYVIETWVDYGSSQVHTAWFSKHLAEFWADFGERIGALTGDGVDVLELDVQDFMRPPGTGLRYFYVRCLKQNAHGGHVLWWRPECSGYTADVGQAGLYTEQRLPRCSIARGDAAAVPVDVVHAALKCVVEPEDIAD